MQWSRIQVEMPDSSIEVDARLGVGESGLDSTAEQMHGEFMGSIPHLEEVKQEHQEVISDLSKSVRASKDMSREIQPVGDCCPNLEDPAMVERLPSLCPLHYLRSWWLSP